MRKLLSLIDKAATPYQPAVNWPIFNSHSIYPSLPNGSSSSWSKRWLWYCSPAEKRPALCNWGL